MSLSDKLAELMIAMAADPELTARNAVNGSSEAVMRALGVAYRIKDAIDDSGQTDPETIAMALGMVLATTFRDAPDVLDDIYLATLFVTVKADMKTGGKGLPEVPPELRN